MGWTYRIVKKEYFEDGESNGHNFYIVETYDNGYKEKPNGYTDAVTVSSYIENDVPLADRDNLAKEKIREHLEKMLLALDMPVLDFMGDNNVSSVIKK